MGEAEKYWNRVAAASRSGANESLGKSLGEMTPDENQAFWDALQTDLMNDTGEAAHTLLAAGHPIYIREDDTPKGLVIKHYPDGRRELVYFDEEGEKLARSGS